MLPKCSVRLILLVSNLRRFGGLNYNFCPGLRSFNLWEPEMHSLTCGAPRPTANLELKFCTLHQNRYWKVHKYSIFNKNTNCKALPYIFPSKIFLGSNVLLRNLSLNTPNLFPHLEHTNCQPQYFNRHSYHKRLWNFRRRQLR